MSCSRTQHSEKASGEARTSNFCIPSVTLYQLSHSTSHILFWKQCRCCSWSGSTLFSTLHTYILHVGTSCKNCWKHQILLPLLTPKAQITTAEDNTFCYIFPNFFKKKVWYFMRIVCQQAILMEYHALFAILKKQYNLKLVSAAKCRWRFKG